mgnify:CR=1 FL=1
MNAQPAAPIQASEALRKKLANAAGGKNFIETVWGRGYVLREGAPPMNDDSDMRASA